MSARRQARARDVSPAVSSVGGVPRSLLIGACIEVWGADSSGAGFSPPGFSARRRFGAVRLWWLDQLGLEPGREAFKTIPPAGAPWSMEYLIYRGVEDLASERLARAGCTLHDVPDLRHEATQLHNSAASAVNPTKRVC